MLSPIKRIGVPAGKKGGGASLPKPKFSDAKDTYMQGAIGRRLKKRINPSEADDISTSTNSLINKTRRGAIQ